jgi:large subunit ribosomal protein L15
MKLHDLKPAPGSRKAKRRVGRGIAAGQGKTAGRGTKGQKARAGGSIPAWFEGGQTPLHQRLPKLRGFKNKFKIEYEVVNIGDIARLVELGELEGGEMPGAKPSKKGAAPITVNQEILRAAGLVRRLDRPMKVLGAGDLSAALFVVADAFSGSARSKIEAAGGTVSVLEVPTTKREALGLDDHAADHDGEPAAEAASPATEAAEAAEATEGGAPEGVATAGSAEIAPPAEEAQEDAAPAKPARASKSKAAKADADAGDDAPAEDAGSKPAKPRAARKTRATEPDTDA